MQRLFRKHGTETKRFSTLSGKVVIMDLRKTKQSKTSAEQNETLDKQN